MLRRGGVIIANELTTKTDFLTLTFGLTDGWWLYDDPQWRMPGVTFASLPECNDTKPQALIIRASWQAHVWLHLASTLPFQPIP